MQRPAAIFMHYGLWTAVLLVALALEVIPVFLVVTMFGLAVGVPKGPALLVIPVVLVGMIVIACLIAARVSRRVRSPSRRVEGVFDNRARPRWAVGGRPESPAEHFRNINRLG